MSDFSAKREFERCVNQTIEYQCSLEILEYFKNNATKEIITEDDLKICKRTNFNLLCETHEPNDEYVKSHRSKNTVIKKRDHSFSFYILCPMLFVSILVLYI